MAEREKCANCDTDMEDLTECKTCHEKICCRCACSCNPSHRTFNARSGLTIPRHSSFDS